jgi:hypothetical protein
VKIQELGSGLYVMDLVINKHFVIKENKHGVKKFKLKSKLKKTLKKCKVSWYFLWGHEFPTQIVLRKVKPAMLTFLSLYGE